MAFPQTKTPLPLTVRKRQRRINSSAVPLLLPVQSPAPQCASNNARPVITGACRSRLLGRSTAHSAGKLGEDLPTDALHCLAPSGSSLQHSFRVLFLVIAEYFTATEYTLLPGRSQEKRPFWFFIRLTPKVKLIHAMAALSFPAGIRPYRAGDTETFFVAHAAEYCW